MAGTVTVRMLALKNGVYNCLDFDLVEINDSWYLVRAW